MEKSDIYSVLSTGKWHRIRYNNDIGEWVGFKDEGSLLRELSNEEFSRSRWRYVVPVTEFEFQQLESDADGAIQELLNIVMRTEREDIIKAYQRLDDAYTEFQTTLTNNGFKGYWNGYSNLTN